MARQLELLAPAKNIDIGIAAIDCGADAVYIAGPAFGARQAAGNSIEDIAELCTHAHRYGARIFITLNTILYDEELDKARGILHGIEEAGADAVIVQDMAIAAAAAEDGLHIPLHASTQCAIQTPEQARFYESLGFSRLVLERQLSLDSIREIRKAVSCELEFFVHGALCVCYSGQCYLSEMIAGRSANRGACIQACRSRYDLCDRNGRTMVKDKPLLSLKDLNLRDRLEDLAEAGITSFKIEGRLKNKSYVKNTVMAYSAELDRIISGKAGDFCRASYGTTEGGFTPDLDKTFNRGYTELYIDGQKGRWNSTDAAKSMGEEIGTVTYVSKSKDTIKIKPAKGKDIPALHNGDGFAFVSGSDVIGFRADICNGLEIRCRKVPELKEGIRLYRNLDSAFEKEIDKAPISREIRVSLAVVTQDRGEGNDGRFTITVSARTEDGRTAEITFPAGDTAAENRERMMAMISGQLSRHTGIYSFAVTGITCREDDGSQLPFLPASFLNGIRRDIAERLDSMPCNRRPLLSRKIHIPDTPSAGQEGACTTYKDNVSNSIARNLYAMLGRKPLEPAYELSHRPGAELMRSRYCIRHELGICPRQKAGERPDPLYLVNNGKRLVLDFDCRRCEMTVKES